MARDDTHMITRQVRLYQVLQILPIRLQGGVRVKQVYRGISPGILPSLPCHRLGQISRKIFPSFFPFTCLRVIIVHGIFTFFFHFLKFFGLFARLVFKAQKGAFAFQTIIKDILLAYIAGNIKMEKWPIFAQNHGLTLDFSKGVSPWFWSKIGRFFVLHYRGRHFAGLQCLK